MMNWLYTWYKPRVDPDAETIAGEMSDIFLRGVRAEKAGDWKPRRAANLSRKAETDGRPKSKAAKRKPAPPLARGRTRS
jgi:hypothetical protein